MAALGPRAGEVTLTRTSVCRCTSHIGLSATGASSRYRAMRLTRIAGHDDVATDVAALDMQVVLPRFRPCSHH